MEPIASVYRSCPVLDCHKLPLSLLNLTLLSLHQCSHFSLDGLVVQSVVDRLLIVITGRNQARDGINLRGLGLAHSIWVIGGQVTRFFGGPRFAIRELVRRGTLLVFLVAPRVVALLSCKRFARARSLVALELWRLVILLFRS